MSMLALAVTAAALAQPPAFEVVSVREYRGAGHRMGPLAVTGPLVRLEGYTVFALVMDAWHLRDFQLDFGKVNQETVAGTMYDITARTAGDGVPRLEDVRTMLRTLLEDRFAMRTHIEKQERKVLTLVAGRNGPKLKPASTTAPCRVLVTNERNTRNNIETFINCPVERLAEHLTQLMFEPVLDQTGIAGTFDFEIKAVPEYRTRKGADPSDILPITAVGELGLKMVPKKERVDILKIDSFAKPTGN